MACYRWLACFTLTVWCVAFKVNAIPTIDDPRFEIDDAPATRQIGTPVIFMCHFQYRRNIDFNTQSGGKIIWTKDGQTVAQWPITGGQRAPERYILSLGDPFRGGFFADLEIISLVAEDQGNYSCRIENGNDVDLATDTVHLVVEYAPSNEYPECSVRSVGEEKILVCLSERGNPHVSLQWWKDDQPLQQTIGDGGESFVEVHSTAAGADGNDMGRFECSLTYKGSREESCILDRPEVRIPTITSGFGTGQDITVTCLASGNPPASVSWDFNPPLHASFVKNGAVLRISNITSRDNGTELICEGHNAMGSNIARSVIVLLPLVTIPLPVTVDIEQTETPGAVGMIARFECHTTPQQNCEWLYNGHYVDPANTADRFFVEGGSNNVMYVRDISQVDVMALVTCYVMVSYRPKAEMYLEVGFFLTTNSPPTTTLPQTISRTTLPANSPPTTTLPQTISRTTLPEETLFNDISTADTTSLIPQTTNFKTHPFTPKIDTSQSKDDSSFFNSEMMGYIIGGLMCVVLVGICCWVSLKAKTLLSDGNRATKSVHRADATPAATSCQINGDDFAVSVRMPGDMTPAQILAQSLLTKEQLVEQEAPYQDLEDVSSQKQNNAYQRLINNVWMPPPLPSLHNLEYP